MEMNKKPITETIDGSIQDVIQLKTLDNSLEYSQMFDALEDCPREFQMKLVQALNSIGEKKGIPPTEAFNKVLCAGEDDDIKRKLYTWWRGVFEVLAKCEIPSDKEDEFNQKVDDLMAEAMKGGDNVEDGEDDVVSEASEPRFERGRIVRTKHGGDQVRVIGVEKVDGKYMYTVAWMYGRPGFTEMWEDELCLKSELRAESYEQADKKDEDGMMLDMKFAIQYIGEIANKVQALINFVNPYCKSKKVNEGMDMKDDGQGLSQDELVKLVWDSQDDELEVHGSSRRPDGSVEMDVFMANVVDPDGAYTIDDIHKFGAEKLDDILAGTDWDFELEFANEDVVLPMWRGSDFPGRVDVDNDQTALGDAPGVMFAITFTKRNKEEVTETMNNELKSGDDGWVSMDSLIGVGESGGEADMIYITQAEADELEEMVVRDLQKGSSVVKAAFQALEHLSWLTNKQPESDEPDEVVINYVSDGMGDDFEVADSNSVSVYEFVKDVADRVRQDKKTPVAESDNHLGFKVGDKVCWTDPDGGETTCGWEVVDVDDEMVVIKNDAGSLNEVLPSEIKLESEVDLEGIDKFIEEFKAKIEAKKDGKCSFEIDEYGPSDTNPIKPWCLLWCKCEDEGAYDDMDGFIESSKTRISDVAKEIGDYELDYARFADDDYDAKQGWEDTHGVMLDVVFKKTESDIVDEGSGEQLDADQFVERMIEGDANTGDVFEVYDGGVDDGGSPYLNVVAHKESVSYGEVEQEFNGEAAPLGWKFESFKYSSDMVDSIVDDDNCALIVYFKKATPDKVTEATVVVDANTVWDVLELLDDQTANKTLTDLINSHVRTEEEIMDAIDTCYPNEIRKGELNAYMNDSFYEIVSVLGLDVEQFKKDGSFVDKNKPVTLENGDELNNPEKVDNEPKKFKNDDGKTQQIVTGEKKQFNEMTIEQDITSLDQLYRLLWGPAKDNLDRIRETDWFSTQEGQDEVLSAIEQLEIRNLSELNDALSYDFETLLEILNCDLDLWHDELEVRRLDESTKTK